MRICFLIRRMDVGGAERQLLFLVRGLAKRGHSVSVIEYYEGGGFVPELLKIPGVTRVCLKKQGRWDTFHFVRRMLREIRALNPDIVHGYGEPANIFTVIVKALVGKPIKAVFGIRSSHMHLERHDWVSKFTGFLERTFSRFADLVIANSISGRDYCKTHGFSADRVVAIQNGIDVDNFLPDAHDREEQRNIWGVKPGELLIGLVARMDPKKNHAEFIKAAKVFDERGVEAKFVLVGSGGKDAYREQLQCLVHDLGIENKVIWAGQCRDMKMAYNALDLLTLCSNAAEGFPNVVAEAMACGVLAVVTTAGDTREIIASEGVLIDNFSPECIADGWQRGSELRSAEISSRVRNRIVQHFSLDQLTDNSEKALLELLKPKEHRG